MQKSGIGAALRKIAARLLLVFLGLVLAIGALEVALSIVNVPNRFALNQQLAAQWESDDDLLLRLKPNLNLRVTAHPEFQYTVITNSDGLRDEAFEGAFDIAAIGDSFTFGFGVEEPEAWPARLENISGLRVANLGWAGWSSYVYPTTIKRYAIPLQTRIWVWAFFMNDLTESAGAAAFIESGRQDFKTFNYQEPPFPFNLKSFGAMMAFANPDYRLLPGSGDKLFDNGEWQMLLSRYAWINSDPSNPDVQRGWELTEAALAEAQQLAAQHDARILLVFVPAREHVYWPVIRDEMTGVNVEQLDSAAARLAQMADDSEIAFFNLLPGFRAEAEQGHMLYFPADGHWNPAGHELAARLIYERLLAR